jgi:hypothetical protein
MIIGNFGRTLVMAMLAMVALPTTLAKPVPQPNPNPSSLGSWNVHAKRTTSIPATYVAQGPAEDDQVVTLRIGVKMGDEEGLERELMRASMPGAGGEYLSREEVGSFSVTVQAIADADGFSYRSRNSRDRVKNRHGLSKNGWKHIPSLPKLCRPHRRAIGLHLSSRWSRLTPFLGLVS